MIFNQIDVDVIPIFRILFAEWILKLKKPPALRYAHYLIAFINAHRYVKIAQICESMILGW